MRHYVAAAAAADAAAAAALPPAGSKPPGAGTKRQGLDRRARRGGPMAPQAPRRAGAFAFSRVPARTSGMTALTGHCHGGGVGGGGRAAACLQQRQGACFWLCCGITNRECLLLLRSVSVSRFLVLDSKTETIGSIRHLYTYISWLY